MELEPKKEPNGQETQASGGETDINLADISLGDIPDTVTSFPELQKHLAGLTKKPDAKADDTPKTVTMEQFKTLEEKLLQSGKTNEQIMAILTQLAATKGGAEEKTAGVNFFPDIEDPATDVPTAAQINTAFTNLMAAMQQGFANLNTVASKPDYANVTKEFLPGLMAERPGLAQAFKNGNLAEIGYHLADLVRQIKNPPKEGETDLDKQLANASPTVKKLLESLSKPGAGATIGGGAPTGSQGKFIDNMPDEDFGKLVDAVINGELRIPR